MRRGWIGRGEVKKGMMGKEGLIDCRGWEVVEVTQAHAQGKSFWPVLLSCY